MTNEKPKYPEGAIKVLDHGFVRLIDTMGDDSSIVQAARVSYGKGTKTKSSDRGLIRYLMRHRHTTPFEMCEIKLHIKAPMFIARQWLRHRTASVNEVSARYSILPDDCYTPPPERIRPQSKTNGQGVDMGGTIRGSMHKECAAFSAEAAAAHDEYHRRLDTGMAREQARINLPLSTYTEWFWKIDLHNLLHFLSLRNHPHAQYEIRAYAAVIDRMVAEWCPIAHEAFADYRINGATLSAAELDILRACLDKRMASAMIKSARAAGRISKREAIEMRAKMGLEA